LNFKGKTVVITGGTRGIGFALTSLFEKAEANIIVTGKKAESNPFKDFNRINYHQLDLESNKSIDRFIDFINKINKIDILINNAGINKIDYLTDISIEDWDNIHKVNLRGPFKLAKEIAKKLKIQEFGKIINIASIYGVISKSKRAAYSSTKWGLIGFTKAIALELAQYNIQVNAISPGFVDTDLTRKILGDKKIKELVSTIPLKRMAKPEEVANLALFLASDQNSYITGQNIIIDGGYTSG
jgi:3-oxoacyl-[acyl-carrier protein] reductase